jgi:hypothetical protein
MDEKFPSLPPINRESFLEKLWTTVRDTAIDVIKWTPGYRVSAAGYDIAGKAIDGVKNTAGDILDEVGDITSSIGSSLGGIG